MSARVAVPLATLPSSRALSDVFRDVAIFFPALALWPHGFAGHFA